MSVCSSWIHGNALTMESPFYISPNGEVTGRLILTPFRWGAEVLNDGVAPAPSWMHLPIPTIREGVSRFERFELLRVFLLGQCSGASIDNIHIYDGYEKIQEFNDRGFEGTFLTKGSKNTFELEEPHTVKSGISLSFFFVPRTIPQGKLVVAAAGAEFEISSVFSVHAIISRLFPTRWRP
jgi:hypothetical protein